MGLKTFESIRRPLPGRENVVVTTEHAYQPAGCTVHHSIDEALQALHHHEEVMVIGGASLYERLLPKAERIYLTLIETEFDGDTFFPEMDRIQWREIARERFNDDGAVGFAYSFVVLERQRGA